jgi:prevent-host-death family protein
MIVVMIMVNIADAKARLSEYLDAVGRGQRVVICRHNRPVAELRAVASGLAQKRKLGAAAGMVDIPPSFHEPLPDDLLNGFDGTPRDEKASARGAERRPKYRVPKARRRPRQA